MIGVAKIDGKRAAHDRLDAVSRKLLGKFQRPEHVVGIRKRQRWLVVGFRKLCEACNRQRAFQQRIRRVYVQVHEIEAGHW